MQPYTREYAFTAISRPKTTLTLSAEVGGRVENVFVDVGGSVADDGMVVRIDPTFVKLDLEKNRIEQQETLRRLELEKLTTLRYRNLIDQNSAALAQYDEALARADVLEIRLQSLKNEEVRLEERLRRHNLSAPPGWKVIRRLVEVGQYVSQGQAVMELGDFTDLVVSFLFTVEELDLLERSIPLTLYFPERDMALKAKIYRVSPDMDRDTRKIAVDLLVSPSGSKERDLFRGGLRAELVMQGREEEGLYLVPDSSLKSRYEAHWLTTLAGREVKVLVIGRVEGSGKAIVTGEGLDIEESYQVRATAGN
ncbi:MAG: efflux RND transporter periplasmic adaptor subunit [Desulfopila sp.]|nr:efflux RND transporter periplasmic adaptor subunit [Desulfopila sp.]